MRSSKINWSEFLFKGTGVFVAEMFVCILVTSVSGGLVPHFIRSLAKNYDNGELYYLSMLHLLIIFTVIYLNRVIYQLIVNKYVKLVIQHVRTSSYARWMRSFDLIKTKGDVSNRERFPQGEVLARLINDTEVLRELITSGSFAILIDIFFIISCLVGFVLINTVSGVSIALFVVVVSVLLFCGSRYMRKVFLSVRHSRGMLARAVANIVGGLREIYYTDHGGYASKRGMRYFVDFLKKQLKSNFLDAFYYSLAESLYPIFLILVVVIFPYSKIVEAAVIFAIIDLIQRSIQPIKDFSGKIANIQRAHAGLVRISDFNNSLRWRTSSVFVSQITEPGSVPTFEFDTLMVNIGYFEYPGVKEKNEGGREVFAISDISFTACSGELIGIVGASGHGKSTVLNIIAGNIFPDDANIVVTGKKGERFSFPSSDPVEISAYKGHVGIVSQDSHIFSETLEFNITLQSKVSSDFDYFWEWIKGRIPYLRSWGIKAHDKLELERLSLGQKQLLSAIRSCYLKKSIVLFDEISSGLDSELEYALRSVLLLVQKNSLTFIVAHRLETVSQSDRILVMERGRFVASGNHDDLLKDSPVYQNFVREMSFQVVKRSEVSS